MKIEVEVNDKIDCSFSEKKLKSIVEKVVNEFDFAKTFFGSFRFSVAFVSPIEMQKINKEYRQKNAVTDILSFANYNDLKINFEKIVKKNKEEIFIGEMILCYEDIREYAEREKKDFEKEITEVIIHGTLHLFGFSHSEEMFSMQRKIIKLYKYPVER